MPKKEYHLTSTASRICEICGTNYTWVKGQTHHVCGIKCERELKRGVREGRIPRKLLYRPKPRQKWKKARRKNDPRYKGPPGGNRWTPEKLRKHRVANSIKKLDKVDLTYQQVHQLRKYITNALDDQIRRAHMAIMGEKDEDGNPVEFSQVQARLFNIFINKAMPDLKQSHVTTEDVTPMSKLSREQLEALAAQAAEREKDEQIDITPDTSTEQVEDDDE